ncbi:hypothetical protein T552_01223 [Pneumocystis carinii B80]|uniref:Dpy-30 domain-containing protein n=1 Tax=Pneumocystis carinii (strain B80) TaxID=1408658 RepID=A0A0W4ZLP6_PNEC8|nr:hypothetical protein T552_01223 [Pneumocystis carinii B80]KTW29268.1 hypothetical protein T552_01223 [Pneumocystis carinii B80]
MDLSSLKETQDMENCKKSEENIEKNIETTLPKLETPILSQENSITQLSSHSTVIPNVSLPESMDTNALPLRETIATNTLSQNNVISTVPTRVYLNENITPVLLEGMKIIARERPPNPLQVLGEYLISKSKK